MSISLSAQPFFERTKHKPIKRMTRREVKEAVIGRTLYERCGNDVIRNARTPWGTIKKPKHHRPYWYEMSDSKMRRNNLKNKKL